MLASHLAVQPDSAVGDASLSDKIYLELKRALVTGVYEPGDGLSIRKLAEQVGTSAMPVREALKRLAAERALTCAANRSFKVPKLEPQKVAELFTLRSILEGAAAERAAPLLTIPKIKLLHRLARALDTHIDSQDYRGYLSDNHKFHFTIYNAAGNDEMAAIIEQLWVQTSPSLYLGLRRSSNSMAWATRHEDIANAIEARNAERARQLIEDDINWGTSLYRTLGSEVS